MRVSPLRLFALLTVASVGVLFACVAAADPCKGEQVFTSPRPERSCQTVTPQVFVSPDGAAHALVYPSDVDLNATPDMESRIVLRGGNGKLLNSKDYSSPQGANGYYVVHAAWSPDSRFFVFSLSSSGGHSPWSFPTWVYSRERNAFVDFSSLIGGNPTLAAAFRFTGPHQITAATWDKPGSQNQVPVTVDLVSAIEQGPAPAN